MNNTLILDITDEGEGIFQATLQGDYDIAKPLFDLNDAADYTEGVLGTDLASARVLAQFLLEHQEAGLLPPMVEISDVVAAYDGANDRLRELQAAN